MRSPDLTPTDPIDDDWVDDVLAIRGSIGGTVIA